MEIIFLPEAKEELNEWVKAGNKPILKKIFLLIEDITKSPFEGI